MPDLGPMVQLNVRIPARLKEQGSAALDSVGLSPSAAVRALWEKAAKRGKDLDEVAELLLGPAEDADAAGQDDLVARGHALWAAYVGGDAPAAGSAPGAGVDSPAGPASEGSATHA